MKNATQVLAANVRGLMQARGWKLLETARRSGVGKSTLANIVNYRDHDDTHASTHTVELLARAFGKQAWELLQPPDTQPEPAAAALDVELLTSCIRAAAGVFRDRGALPDDAQLAAAAAFLYRRVNDGATLKQAGNTVAAELARIGTNPATFRGLLPGEKGGGKVRKAGK